MAVKSRAVKRNVTLLSSDPFQTQLKMIGWSWILLGAFWLCLALLALLVRPPQAEDPWNEPLAAIEIAVFAGTVISGLALLWRWRWSPVTIWIASIIWFSFSMYAILPDVLSPHLIGYGPSLVLSVYSPILMLRLAIHRRKINPDSEGERKGITSARPL